MAYNYFQKEHALKHVSSMMSKTGDAMTITKGEHLNTPLEFVQNDLYYPSIVEKTSYLFFSFNKNHFLLDGNKRASVLLSGFFLEINGYDFLVTDYMQRIENFAIYVAEDKVDKGLLTKIVSSILYCDNHDEQLKLEIFNAIFGN